MSDGRADLGGDDAVAAVPLRLVEGRVGHSDHRFRLVFAREAGGYAEAGGDLHEGFSIHDMGGLHGAAQLLGAAAGAFKVGVGKDDEEFLAAVAANRVVGADGLAEDCGHFFENPIANHMAEGVVDGFEVVDIGEDDAERGSPPRRDRSTSSARRSVMMR